MNVQMKPAQRNESGISLFSGEMKMAEIIEANPGLLDILSRLDVRCDFGDRTVDEVCRLSGVDTPTFLMLCNVYTFDGYIPSSAQIGKGRVRDIVLYLRKSHKYYLDEAVTALQADIEGLLAPCSASQRAAVWKFFTEYRMELEKHFDYEERVVFPYVDALLGGGVTDAYSIGQFEEHHSNIEEKLNDLKNIVMKYLPPACEDRLRIRVLEDVFRLRADLVRHTDVENGILIPMVSRMEEK